MQELTGAIRKGGQAQYLDKLQVERERGITVKVRLTSCAKHMQASALLTLELNPCQSYRLLRAQAVNEGITVVFTQPSYAKSAVLRVQAQTASLVYRHKGEDYLLNLVDTPGHVGVCSTVVMHSVIRPPIAP